ncbi:hypothetical protein [Acinetobacter sp. MD2(2019)]|uniref:hypothetical protein n=1 Tax=Acinetobacter sp. MD2(2019) TaxID=2605273 RepID=UPI002D1E89EA|nr:hypothetical protein [Acinetobacter sp. MD2(2019)]MEB3754265.1 hypothetical protein [Acinetobacter sp. MD2(2019)]
MAKIRINDAINLNPTQFNCVEDYGCITDIKNWVDVLALYKTLKQQLFPKKIFLVLDDLAQAEYTSMHACHDDRLYIPEHISEQLSDDENEQEYSALALHYYIQQFLAAEHQQHLSDFGQKMQHYDRADFETLMLINKNPLPCLDTDLDVKIADVPSEPLKLAMLPNGYFSCDFDPFENFTIIQFMHSFGFDFIGLGAALLGFIKTDKCHLDANNCEAVMQGLSSIYPFNTAEYAAFKQLICSQDYLLLPYSESPQEYANLYD